MAVRITDTHLQLPEQSGSPAASDTNSWRLIAKSGGLVAVDDSAGEFPLLTSGADVALEDNPLLAAERTTATTPASGYRKLYAKSDGWYDLDDTGTETQIGSGSGGGVTSGARVHTTGTLPTVPAWADVTIDFTAILFDTDNYFDGIAPNFLTPPDNALYMVQAEVLMYFDSTPTPAGNLHMRAGAGSHAFGGVAFADDENMDYCLSASHVANLTSSDTCTITIKNRSGQTVTVYAALAVVRIGETLA